MSSSDSVNPLILYKHIQNGWYWANSRERLYLAISSAIRKMRWLSVSKAKYLTVRIDMRTGSFLLLDGYGDVLSEDDTKKLLECHINTLPMINQEERNDHKR